MKKNDLRVCLLICRAIGITTYAGYTIWYSVVT